MLRTAGFEMLHDKFRIIQYAEISEVQKRKHTCNSNEILERFTRGIVARNDVRVYYTLKFLVSEVECLAFSYPSV